MTRQLGLTRQAHQTLAGLAAAGRDIRLPIILDLDSGNLHIERALRLLPKRRLTAWATLDRAPVIAKLFFSDPKATREGEQEASRLVAMQQRGIAAPRLLADTGPSPAGRLLLIEALGGTDAQARYQQARQQSAACRPLILQLVVFMASLHNNGCLQQDAHLGNFLIDGKDCWLLDAGGVSLKASLSRRQRGDNLALLLAQLYPQDLPPLADLLTTYGQHAQQAPSLAALEQALSRARHKRYRHAINKIYRDCTEFARLTKGELKGMVRRADKAALEALLNADIDQVMAKGEVLKRGNSSSVSRVSWQQQDWVIKRYNIKGPVHRLKKQFKPSRAATSWRNARWLDIIGLNTPGAIGFVEQRQAKLLGRAYYISQHIPATPIDQLDGAALQQAQTAMEAIFPLMQQFHFNHGDMKASNFLWRDGKLWFLDLDAMQLDLSASQARRLLAKDVARWRQNWS